MIEMKKTKDLITKNQVKSEIEKVEEASLQNEIQRNEIQEDISKRSDDLGVEEAKEAQKKMETLVDEQKELRSYRASLNLRFNDIQDSMANSLGSIGNPNERKSWLASEEALERFAEIGHQARDAKEIKSMWGAELNKRGISFVGDAPSLPELYSSKIEDTFQKNGKIWNRVTKNAGDYKTFLLEVGKELGYGDNRADKINDKKTPQELLLDSKVIEAEFIYKIHHAAEKDLRTIADYKSYLMYELPMRLVETIERAIVVGDGLDGVGATAITSIEPIHKANADHKTDVVLTDGIDHTTLTTLWAELGANVNGAPVLIGHKKDLVQFMNAMTPLGTAAYNVEMTAEGHTVNGYAFIEKDWVIPTAELVAGEHGLTMVALADYNVVGDNTPVMATQTNLDSNTVTIRSEAFIGGALTGSLAAAVVAVPAGK